MVPLYPDLLKYSVEYRIYSRQMIADHKGEKFEFNAELEKIPMAENYILF